MTDASAGGDDVDRTVGSETTPTRVKYENDAGRTVVETYRTVEVLDSGVVRCSGERGRNESAGPGVAVDYIPLARVCTLTGHEPETVPVESPHPYEHIDFAALLGREDDADLSPVEVFEACLLAQESDTHCISGDPDDYPEKAVEGAAEAFGARDEDGTLTDNSRKATIDTLQNHEVDFLKEGLE